MGLLNDTVLDAFRPLPVTGDRLRRSVDPNIEAAPDAMEDTWDDSGALTIYRLQKDGGSGLPAVPSDPRAGDAGMRQHGPLSAPAVNSRVHDASTRVDIWKSGLETGERQEGTTQSEAKDRQERFATAVSTHPSEDAVSFKSRSDPGRTPEVKESVSNRVERDESESNARRETGRGTPSGAPGTQAVKRTIEEETIANDGRFDVMAGTTPNGGGESIPAAANATPSRRGGSRAVAVERDAPDDAIAGQASTRGVRQADEAASIVPAALSAMAEAATDASLAEPGVRPPADTPAGQSPVRTPEYRISPEAGPRLRIGRIDVLVVADEKPNTRSSPSRDDSFLSRNYLRRL